MWERMSVFVVQPNCDWIKGVIASAKYKHCSNLSSKCKLVRYDHANRAAGKIFANAPRRITRLGITPSKIMEVTLMRPSHGNL